MIKWKLVFEFLLTLLIPFFYFANILIIALNPQTFNLPISLKFLGIIIASFGLTIWIVSFINLGTSFGVLPQKQKRIKKGIYKYFKHPMYVGICSAFLGLSIANASWQGLIFLNIIITPLLYFRAYWEDKKLTD